MLVHNINNKVRYIKLVIENENDFTQSITNVLYSTNNPSQQIEPTIFLRLALSPHVLIAIRDQRFSYLDLSPIVLPSCGSVITGRGKYLSFDKFDGQFVGVGLRNRLGS